MEIYNTHEVKNVILFSSGLDSTLTYIKLKNKLPALKLFYVPIVIPKVTDYINAEISTIRLLSKRGVNFINHQVDFGTREAALWSNTYQIPEEPDYIPYRNVGLILMTVIRYPNLKNIYIGGMADDNIEDNNKENLKLLQNAIRRLGKNKDVMIKSAFNWSKFKHEAIQEVLDKVKGDASKLANTLEFILLSYSSYGYSLTSKRNELVRWFRAHIKKMEFKYPSVGPTIHKLLSSTEEIPSIDRRTYNTKADFRYNVALYASLGIIFPFNNKRLIMQYKQRALSTDNSMPKERRRIILDYITALEDLILMSQASRK